jgi:hypothetical protein
VSGSDERFDLLRVPVVGSFLHWRGSRVVMQTPLLLVSIVMIWHAFFGPQLAPKNLATLLTWVHFRGLVVLVLLLGGNFFCMACPFMLPRNLARRFISPRWTWPRWLRNKTPAILLFVGVLFVYEWLDLWSDPWATGILIVGYFAAAFLVDLVFKRASFCKFVCPIGQFNFVASTVSPLEVSVRDPNVCATCHTHDCIAGTHVPPNLADLARARSNRVASSTPIRGKLIQRGCELDLYQPRKVGNLDCTFCLDCVHACPHDNVGLLARVPAEEIISTQTRSGIGNLDRRSDWSWLAIVFVFGAVLNAFAMISPVYTVEQTFAHMTGFDSKLPVLAALFIFALVIEPAILLGGAAWLTRRTSETKTSLWQVINRFARVLVPLGLGVWLAHYGFHFLTGFLTVIPVTQYTVHTTFGADFLGAPQWQLAGLPQSLVLPIELGFLGLGAAGSLAVAWRTAAEFAPTKTFRAFAPWAVLAVLLLASAGWTMSQPMDMRGTFVAR